MFSRFLLAFVLVSPVGAEAVCSSQRVGEMTFSDCPAESHAVNNAAESGIALQPISDAAAKANPVRLVQPYETLDMSGRAPGPTSNASEKAAIAPSSPLIDKKANRKTPSGVTKKPAKQGAKNGTK